MSEERNENETGKQRGVRLRGERDGSGPIRCGSVRSVNVGARDRFALLGEVLVVGLLVTVIGLGIVTLPGALAAGVRHLRRFIRADDSRLAYFWRDVSLAILPGAVIGVVGVLLSVLLLADIALGASGAVPRSGVVAGIGWVGLGCVVGCLLLVSGRWDPQAGWLRAVQQVPSAIRHDPVGAVYIVATAGFVIVATWALAPLFIPAIGCAALAIVAVPARPRRRGRVG